MAQPVSVRLEDDNKKNVDRFAKMTKRSRSFVINEAIAAYLEDRIQYLDELNEAVADARSGYFLTSNIRPIILLLITLSIISGFFFEYDVTPLTNLGSIIFSAYFGSRGIEKVFGNYKHK